MSTREKEEHYQIIARKFRPQTFADVVGQDAIVTTLKNALRSGRTAQAYLFCGTRGTGKTTFARLLAKALNCTSLTSDLEPCNACPSCIDITKSRSLNVLEIDGASNRGIDDIRQINETTCYASISGKYKIYIIDEVHMLTKEAFNALLKTLEEPPENVKFLFATTEPHKILPTIVSRCQRFDLNRLSAEEIKLKLRSIVKELGIEIEEDALALISYKAEGSLRDAESLLDQISCLSDGTITLALVSAHFGVISKDSFFQLDNAIYNQDVAVAFTFIEKLFESGKDIHSFFDSLLEHFRTLLCLKFPTSSATPVFLNEKERTQYHQSASLYKEEHLLYILDYLVSWAQKLHKTPFQRLYLEMLLLHLIRSRYRITIDHLTKKLIALESSLGNKQEEVKQSPEVEVRSEIPAPLSPPSSLQEEKIEPLTATMVAEEIILETTVTSPAPLEMTVPYEEPKKEDVSLEEKLLSAIKAKINKPVLPKEEKVIALETVAYKEEKLEVVDPQDKPLNLTVQQKSKYDTLIRFAAVELEGTIKE